ncbi:unnamed protein product [Rotaria socialis]|uniref:ZZ-type domain-containing protein n=1 Tax=Rotaria socialis TaxID=392032 RepID=A0A819WGL2_9BILA|nr:unnamed protein product [Rotaria socialis]CAF3487958.1 unnamed protein product [Rotaria socialis]CAF4125389.1 unnamed protein product [Rotaria socialis]CAF4398451.1 unnamed protein product [Rotaria socialis]
MSHQIALFVGFALVKIAAGTVGKYTYHKIVKHRNSKKHPHETQQRQQSPSNRRGFSNYIYQDAYCDGCGKFINDGIRYHCLQCPNFDLCGHCHNLPPNCRSIKGHTADHNMLTMIQ